MSHYEEYEEYELLYISSSDHPGTSFSKDKQRYILRHAADEM
jgi:hypothetical protein